MVLASTGFASHAGRGLAQEQVPQAPQAPLGTAFTYQGYLTDGDSPANGMYDLRFILYDSASGGSQVGSTLIIDDQAVNLGYFTVALDFGASALNGQGRWLEVSVRPGSSSGEYTVLSPRQALTAAPYAVFSQSTPWNGLSSVPEGFADGVDNDWSAHNHLGETWLGEDNPLVITGTFGAPNNAPLVLGNNGDSGDGIQIDKVNSKGIVVNSANVGLYVKSASDVGLFVASAERCGLLVDSVDRYGVCINSAGSDGIYARSTDSMFYGGNFLNLAAGGAGLYAQGGSNTAPDLVLGGNDATNDDGRIYSDMAYSGSDVFLVSNDAVQFELDNDSNEGGNLWVLNGDNTTVFSVNESGDMTAIGNKSAAVNTQDYGTRKLYAVESPQNWFEDFGSAQLVDGAVTVAIEPVFVQTVNLNDEYHVFLTPLGDCSLYVSEKTPQGFTVKAMPGRTCSIAFDYRIVAKRLGYENLRLETATDLVQDEEE